MVSGVADCCSYLIDFFEGVPLDTTVRLVMLRAIA